MLRVRMKIGYEACRKGISVQELIVQAIIKTFKYFVENKHPYSSPRHYNLVKNRASNLSIDKSLEQEEDEDLIYKDNKPRTSKNNKQTQFQKQKTLFKS